MDVMGILSYGLGTLIGFALLIGVVFLFISDITQKKHAVLRNYPVIGRLRYFFEEMGEYFRQYFFAGDRDEMPFNRATRGWVYRLAKNEGGMIGFGSTYDLHEPGAHHLRQPPVPGAGGGAAADAVAHDRRGLLRASRSKRAPSSTSAA